MEGELFRLVSQAEGVAGGMGTAINLNMASVVGEGEDCGDLSVLFLERYDPVEFFLLI